MSLKPFRFPARHFSLCPASCCFPCLFSFCSLLFPRSHTLSNEATSRQIWRGSSPSLSSSVLAARSKSLLPVCDTSVAPVAEAFATSVTGVRGGDTNCGGPVLRGRGGGLPVEGPTPGAMPSVRSAAAKEHASACRRNHHAPFFEASPARIRVVHRKGARRIEGLIRQQQLLMRPSPRKPRCTPRGPV